MGFRMPIKITIRRTNPVTIETAKFQQVQSRTGTRRNKPVNLLAQALYDQRTQTLHQT
jgi:hypothetical protein